MNEKIYNTRQLLLEEIQFKLCLPPEAKDPNSKSNKEYKTHEITLDEFLPIKQIPFVLPLPELVQFGIARLILRLKLPLVVNLLMLLLLEKSILLIGDKYEEVSCCILALLDLLKPYKWSSIIVPIISDDKMNIIESSLSSNIPFIVGMVNKSNDLPFKEQGQYGDLTIVNLVDGDISWTEDLDIRNNQFTHGENNM